MKRQKSARIKNPSHYIILEQYEDTNTPDRCIDLKAETDAPAKLFFNQLVKRSPSNAKLSLYKLLKQVSPKP